MLTLHSFLMKNKNTNVNGNKEEIKNPNTGINVSLTVGFILSLIIIISYVILRKKNYFNKINVKPYFNFAFLETPRVADLSFELPGQSPP